MIVDVSDILKEIGASKNVNCSIVLKDITWQGEPLQFRKPLTITGSLTNSGSILLLNANVRGTVIFQCGLCLEAYEQNLEFLIEARLKKPSQKNNVDDFVYEGNEFDLSKIVWEFLLLEIPTRRCCQENCKGLCPECGANRNKKTCHCINIEENDPDLALDERLQILKDHFSTRGKEV